MFFGEERLAIMREMILAGDLAARKHALDRLLPIQREDSLNIFRVMDGLPVTIRMLDPPLHEFLPSYDDLIAELYELKLNIQRADSFSLVDKHLREVWEKEQLLKQVERLREVNPMLGHRGCRLGLTYPEMTAMQARAITEAACEAQGKGQLIPRRVRDYLECLLNEPRLRLLAGKHTVGRRQLRQAEQHPVEKAMAPRRPLVHQQTCEPTALDCHAH